MAIASSSRNRAPAKGDRLQLFLTCWSKFTVCWYTSSGSVAATCEELDAISVRISCAARRLKPAKTNSGPILSRATSNHSYWTHVIPDSKYVLYTQFPFTVQRPCCQFRDECGVIKIFLNRWIYCSRYMNFWKWWTMSTHWKTIKHS